jgi:hypothetical protein
MRNSTSMRMALAAAGGILAGVAGCGGAPAPAPEVPGAPADDHPTGAAVPASSKAPVEKHACGGAHGCNAGSMQPKGQDPPQPSPGAPKSP